MTKQTVKEIDLGYIPRDWQAKVHKERTRYAIWVLHRRAGKTVALAMEAIQKCLTCELPNPRVAMVYPLRDQAKRVAWPILKGYAEKVPGVIIRESDLQIIFTHNNSSIGLYGTWQNQYESMRGMYFDLACIDEYAQCDKRAWEEVLRPALSDRLGELIICGTPMGRDHFYYMWVQAMANSNVWSSFMLKASESGVIPASELNDAKALMAPDIYEREFECEFTAMPPGAFYANEIKELRDTNRIFQYPVITGKPVIAAMDIGVRDQSVCWFAQVVGTSVNIVNCLVWRDTSLREVIRDIREQPYSLAFLGVPHDASHREQLSNTPKVDAIRDLLPGVFVEVVPRLPVTDGIFLVRRMFSQLCFDRANCSKGIEYLASYKRKFSYEAQAFTDNPVHDDASDYADGLRYLIQLMDILAGGSGIGDGGTIDETVISPDRYRAPRVIGCVTGDRDPSFHY